MATPPIFVERAGDRRSPKRQRFPSSDEDDEDDEDFNSASFEEEDDEDSNASSEEEESEEFSYLDREIADKNISGGHIACSSCCTKLKKRCSFCRSHIGDIRCRAMEKIIEATVVPCPNAISGCKETTTYGGNQSSHKKRCIFIRCSCPLPNCNYVGSYTDLKSHARTAHTCDEDDLIPFVYNTPLIFALELSKRKMVVFQEEKEGELIVVQALKESQGVYVTVSCMAPMTPGLKTFSCSLAKLDGFSTLRLGFMVKKIQKVREQEHPEDGFMLIPSYMIPSNEHWKMQICIGREYKYIHI